VKPVVRLVKDPATPQGLREAIDRAAAETAPEETIHRVLGAAGAGMVGGAIASGLAHATGAAPRWAAASLAAKGVSVMAIFAAGAVAGGFAVHRHDVVTMPPVATVAPSAPRLLGTTVVTPAPGIPEVARAPEAPPPDVPAPVVDPVPPPPAVPVEMRRRAARPAVPVASPAVISPESGLPSAVSAPESDPSVPAPPGPPSARAALESLRSIRDAVDGHRPVDALAGIEAHRAEYPRSPFDQELLLLEAEARWARREPTVCSLLSTFGTLYPRSLLRRRAEALAAEAHCLGGDARP
jgi:hypothetical protein